MPVWRVERRVGPLLSVLELPPQAQRPTIRPGARRPSMSTGEYTRSASKPRCSESLETKKAQARKTSVRELKPQSMRLAVEAVQTAAAVETVAMTATGELSTLVPSAKAMMQKIALAEAEKASEEMRRHEKEEAEKKALIERLTKPSGMSDEQVMKKAAAIIERAAKNGLTEVQVYRFPNSLCTDRGRAINQQEPGWETTLTGIPKEIYEFWDRRLRPLGYRLRVQVIDFSNGVPGDIGVSLKWG
jgi:hypothetical protein